MNRLCKNLKLIKQSCHNLIALQLCYNTFFHIVLLVTSTYLYADFVNLGYGSRVQSIGGAFVGLADDSQAVFYNPAGLSYQKIPEIQTTYGKYLLGLTDESSPAQTFLSAVYPLKFFSVGLGYEQMSLA
ncbi:MAG: hypothetical protein QME68_06065, partial [Elusimicrobiota bacterium]|nr:hypothetical protein [Elusimicrobiota bacterium]